MKIIVFDTCNGKFSKVLVDHWRKNSHEVIQQLHFDPKLLNESTVVFFDFVDNNLMRASDPKDSLWEQVEGFQIKPKKVIARCHDIDYWTGNLNRIQWNWVDDLVFVGPHIKDLAMKDLDLGIIPQVHLIKHGIDLEKFVFKERNHGNKIAFIGNINHQKQPELALQVVAEYPNYELHIVGKGWKNWQKKYVDNFIRRLQLNVHFYDEVESVNNFLEDKNYLLLTSMKEAFSYVVGEAAAKGIKPLIHNFYGAEQIWPKEWIWNKISDIGGMFKTSYNSSEYHNYIKKNYPLDKMLNQYDKLFII